MNFFDQEINRYHTGSIKYDFPERFHQPEGLLPLWVADMDFRTADGIREALKQKAEYGIYGYSDAQDGYYEALEQWFWKRHHFAADRKEVVKTPGVIFAISAAVRAFTQPGDSVMIQQPVYHPFVNCVLYNNRKLVNNPLRYDHGRYTMDLDDFEQKVIEEKVKLFILCSPHNPVGRVWSREELKMVGELCIKHDVFVISDEIHCDFTWNLNQHTVFSGISEEFAQNSVICTAPSKTFNLAGLQVSNLFVHHEEQRRRLKRELYLTGYDELNIFALTACEAAYRSGEEWLEELKIYLLSNLDFVRGFLKEKIPQVKLVEPEGTYLLWLDFSQLGKTPSQLQDLVVEKAGLWLNEGQGFGEEGGQFQRMNIACPLSMLKKAMEQLEEAVKGGNKS